MKHTSFLILFFICLGFLPAGAQSVAELEGRLRRSASKSEKMNLSYQLAERLLTSNPGKAADYAERAANLATELGEKRTEADALYLSGEGHFRRRAYGDAASKFGSAWNTARNYGLRDVALSAVERLQDIATKQNDLREALKWSRETISYLKENGAGRSSGGGDASRRLEAQLRAAEADNRSLREQLAQATGQTQLLETTYRETESKLKEVQEKSQQELTLKDEVLTQISQQKQRADSLIRTKVRLVDELTKEQLADSIVSAQQQQELQTQKRRLAEAELAQQTSEYARNIVGIVAIFVLLLATLFYFRYRAKRRSANELSLKNSQIEAEQKRSNDLLLNILPPAIAEELKTRNKVAARKYDQATVMFIDFTGFTQVAERLSPETLVEELDYCFSNFDNIISQYRIEKIKTIGDAYLCASGLSDMNASPSDMVRAALEVQDFLLGLKAERQSRGLPFFEARIGIHTGPVVAGVVGAKKFAYDIWGDTVNVAARLEQACEPGRVNLSTKTHGLAKYEFEWYERGRIATKNKEAMEMYYVTAIKTW